MSVKHAAKEPSQPSANVAGESLRDDQSNADKDKRRSQVKKNPNDFQFAKIIGEGSYSTVFLAKEISTGNEYAIKVLEKRHILKEKKSQYVMREKEVFSRLNHPFFVRLYFTFQDQERLYFGLSYAKRGELLYYINKLGCFDERCTRFYTSEIIMALEHLHSIGIIHRDLKPENVLLNEQMHIQITDFGTAKILEETEENTTGSQGQSQRRNSFVGTAQYVSPEVLTSKSAYCSSDLWALGCIIYQLLSGQLPFWGGHEYQIFQKIMKCEYEFPAGFHAVGRELVEKLLVCDPTKRLGCKEMGGYGPLKQHPFCEGVDWNNLPETKAPELLPYLPVLAEEENWSTDKKPGLHIDHYIGKPVDEIGFLRISKEERKKLLDKQERENDYRSFVEGNLILKQGFIDKRKGLFARRRMFLLTEGPHLYYVDPQAMVLKGQIPWSKELRPEPKNFKIFFVHTPNRTYYLEDPEGNSLKWCKKIQEVYNYYYSDNKS